jgi:hypothetical protein
METIERFRKGWERRRAFGFEIFWLALGRISLEGSLMLVEREIASRFRCIFGYWIGRGVGVLVFGIGRKTGQEQENYGLI